MNKVAVITDNVSLMSQELASKYDITLIPNHIVMDGRDYLESELILPEFYAKLAQLRKAGNLPQAGGPNAGQILEAYHKLARKTKNILYVTYSPRLGVAFKAATQAKEMVTDELKDVNIEILDTCTACGAQMLIALEAAKAATEGKSLSEVAELARSMVPKVVQTYVVDDLYYLDRGGRIGKAKSWLDSALPLKALFRLDSSTGAVPGPLTRVRNKSQAMEVMLRLMEEQDGDKKLRVVINHADVPEEAEELKKRIASRFDCTELYITPVLPLIAVHNGLGSLWLGWYGEE